MSNARSIQALQRFQIDEIIGTAHGPLVAVTLTLPSRQGGGRQDHIEFAMPLDQAVHFGNGLLDLSDRMKTQEAQKPPQKMN